MIADIPYKKNPAGLSLRDLKIVVGKVYFLMIFNVLVSLFEVTFTI